MEFLHAALKLLFYGGVVFFILFEMLVAFQPKKTLALHEYNDAELALLEARRKENPDYKEPKKDWDDKNYFQQEAQARGIIIVVYTIWCLLGLITGNWLVFAVVLLVGLVSASMPKSIKRNRLYVVFDGAICIVLLGFTIVNAYQLHWSWRDLTHFLY